MRYYTYLNVKYEYVNNHDLDDLLFYLKTQEEHDSHILLVLKRLREHGLLPNWKKCSFECNQVEFLDYVISSEGISMDLAKVKTVVAW